MAFSSDAALAQLPEELRAEMPDYGFRRDLSGRFFFCPYVGLIRGAYEVPDAQLARLAWAVHAHRNRLWHYGGIVLFALVFLTALLLGPPLIGLEGTAASPQETREWATIVVLGGSFAFASAAAALWTRARARHLVRRHLQGLRYQHRTILTQGHEPARNTLWGAIVLFCLTGLFLAVSYIFAEAAVEAIQAGIFGLFVYAAAALALSLWSALFFGMVTANLRRPPCWAPPSSWARPPAATMALWQSHSEAAYRALPLWRKLLVPEHAGRRGRWLEILHWGLYATVIVSVVIGVLEVEGDWRPSDDDLLAFFAEITAPPQHNPDLAPVIVKWSAGPRVFLAGGEEDREGASLEQTLATLGKVTGLDWHRVASPETADIVIEILYGDADSELPEGTDQGNVNYAFGDSGAMTGGKVTVADRESYDNIVHWGLAEIAGLRGDSSAGDDSVTSGARGLTALDRAALLLLYLPEIRPGMKVGEATERARAIAAGWPDTYTVSGLQNALAGQR